MIRSEGHPMLLGRKLLSTLFVLSIFTASLRAQLSATRYEVVDIGASTAMPYSLGTSISNSGYVAGISSNGIDYQQGFSWREDTGIQWLSHPSGTGQSVTSEVNNAGQVVGTSFGPTHGVLWNADGSVAYVFQSSVIDQPTGLNNAGAVTGYRNTLGSQSAYIWDGTYNDLGFPSHTGSTQGYGINDLGQVAGHAGSLNSTPAAFLWSSTSGFTTILTSPTFVHIAVEDLSNQGTMVGRGFFVGGDNVSIGWRWDASKGFSELNTFPAAIKTDALAVNDSGLIVGQSDGIGTIWDQQGAIYNANNLLAPGFSTWSITSLTGVNDNGWLTGYAVLSGSPGYRAVLLRPIPEPASIGLTLLSCASLLMRQRRTGGRRISSTNSSPRSF
jgi:hypothetical protein